MTSPERTYRTAEFAALAGVTVRALRHYDRLGLLRPRRTGSGYRVYTERDLETLEQIVALKLIGVPLKQISLVRHDTGGALADVLGAQRRTLEQKHALLARAIEAIGRVEATLRSGQPAGAPLFRTIIEVIEMHENEQEWTRQYGALLDGKIAALAAIAPEKRAALREEWIALVEEIRQSLDEDPAGPKAQALAVRWRALLQQVTGAIDPAWTSFLASSEQKPNLERFMKNTSDEAKARVNEMGKSYADPRVWEFVQRALASSGDK